MQWLSKGPKGQKAPNFQTGLDGLEQAKDRIDKCGETEKMEWIDNGGKTDNGLDRIQCSAVVTQAKNQIDNNGATEKSNG